MKLMWNRSEIDPNFEKTSEVLIDEPKIYLATDLPYLNLSISSNDKVFIWGDIYISEYKEQNQKNVDSSLKKKYYNSFEKR